MGLDSLGVARVITFGGPNLGGPNRQNSPALSKVGLDITENCLASNRNTFSILL